MSAGRCDVLAPVQCATEDRWPHTRVAPAHGRWWRYLPALGGWCLAAVAETPDEYAAAEAREAAVLARAVAETRAGRVVEGRELASVAAGLDREFAADRRGYAPRPVAPAVEVGVGFLPVDFGPRCPVCRIPHHAYDVEHAADRGQPCARCQGDEHDPQHGPACEPRAEVV